MARGHLMLLSPRTITELLLSDSNHPRLRRHHACVNIIQDYRCNTSITKISPSCSYSIPPTVFKQICRNYNTNVLFQSNDLQISTVGLWRIFVRSSAEPSFLSLCRKSRNFPSTQCVPSHHAIVVRQSKSHVRRKRISIPSTKRVVSILQPDSVSVLYLAENLHSSPHSSASLHSIPAITSAMSRCGVEHIVLSPSSSGTDGIARATGITAMYSNSRPMQSLRKSLSIIQPSIQPSSPSQKKPTIQPTIRPATIQPTIQPDCSFHQELAHYLLSLCNKFDTSRQSGCISHERSCCSAAIKWGWGRIQPDSNTQTWYINNQKMPTLNVAPFLEITKSLQDQIMVVMETATSIALSQDKAAFTNPIRTKLFAKIFNNAMGFESSSSLFEYIHIVIAKNTVLNEHVDHKNDHRPGYNFCSVYSFFHVKDNDEYRISLIMTTRTTIGAAVEKLKKK